MYRLVFSFILALACAAHAAPATGQLDASPTLFTVMAAINMAGYDADLDSPNNHPLRAAVRAELAKKNIPSLAGIKEFFKAHRKPNDTAELSQYISFGLTAGPPPNFAIKARNVDLPPDVTGMLGLSDLLAAFYKEADIENLWKLAQPAFDQYLERYQAQVMETRLAADVYLRQPTSGVHGRNFQIFVELLAAPNQVHARSYGNNSFIVITPSPTPKIFEVRRAYLSYSVDYLATRYQEILMRKKPVFDQAQRSRILEDQYKNDPLLLTSASLVRAIEARMDKQPQKVGEALVSGFVLTPYFYEKLPAYEGQETPMQDYFKEMASAIDNTVEERRLSKVQFLTEKPEAPKVEMPKPAAPPVTELTPLEQKLAEADKLYKARQLDEAKKLYLEILQETNIRAHHTTAYCTLGRIAVLQKDPETAEKLLLKCLDYEPDAVTKSWSYVYLGRLSLAAQEPQEALRYFQNALIVPGAPEDALKAAQTHIEQISKE